MPEVKKPEQEKPAERTETAQPPVKKVRPVTRKRTDDNVIFVGKKPTMSYVLAVMTQFDGNKEIIIKARGRAISRAVDVVEAVRNKFVKDIKSDVKIGTEEVTDSEGRKLNVSTIEITVNR
jgi:DNA-binding protein